MHQTKIVCTLGPASDELDVIKTMIESGMNVARLNFSHGTYEEHKKRIDNVRQASRELSCEIAIMLDTKGPEIRIGMLVDGKATLLDGSKVILTTKEIKGTKERISVSYANLAKELKKGDRILLDDGLIELHVVSIADTEIECVVINGGEISNRKGVNIPSVQIKLPAITEKDEQDILFGIQEEVDFIAASFIRSAADILEIRKILEDNQSDIHIIAKIENQAGLDNINEIIMVSDGIMVARGDLGVEIPPEDVPLAQKDLIDKCNKAGKPVITATQMLDSMIRNPRPTRAEANDVANAIFDGTDAVMLSGETAAGKYPVQSVQTMSRISRRTENAMLYKEITGRKKPQPQKTTTDAISYATSAMASELDAAAIITPTASGSTARMVSKYRPKAQIVAATPYPRVAKKMCLVWGVKPLLVRETYGTDEMITESVQRCLEAGFIALGDLVIITAGVPVGVPGTTNLVKVHIVGEIVAHGMGIGTKVVSGKIKKCATGEEAEARVNPGDILVAHGTDKDYVKAMEKAFAVITEEGGLTSHAAIVGVSMDIPVIVGVENAMEKLIDNTVITVDTARGVIYRGVTKAL